MEEGEKDPGEKSKQRPKEESAEKQRSKEGKEAAKQRSKDEENGERSREDSKDEGGKTGESRDSEEDNFDKDWLASVATDKALEEEDVVKLLDQFANNKVCQFISSLSCKSPGYFFPFR